MGRCNKELNIACRIGLGKNKRSTISSVNHVLNIFYRNRLTTSEADPKVSSPLTQNQTVMNRKSLVCAILMLSVIRAMQSQTYVYLNDGSGNLYQYDSSTWTGSKIFDYASSSIYGAGQQPWSISAGPAANTIYMSLIGGQLATFDVTSKAVAVVGGAGLGGAALGEGRDGFLYMGLNSDLMRITPATGSSVLLGSGAYSYAGDLAVNPLNSTLLYGTVLGPNNDVWLATVDRNDGAQTLIGDTGITSPNSVWGIGFSADGTLYAGGPDLTAGAIWSLDLSTGAATLQTALPFAPYDMATQPLLVSETPEPTSLTLIGLGMAGMGLCRKRRLKYGSLHNVFRRVSCGDFFKKF